MQVDNQEISIVAKRVLRETLRKAVDRAYLTKYSKPGALKYAKDLCSAQSHAATLEGEQDYKNEGHGPCPFSKVKGQEPKAARRCE